LLALQHEAHGNRTSAVRLLGLSLTSSSLHYSPQAEVEAGTLIIRPLTEARLGQATDLLTDTFAATDDVIGLYSRCTGSEATQQTVSCWRFKRN